MRQRCLIMWSFSCAWMYIIHFLKVLIYNKMKNYEFIFTFKVLHYV